MTAEDDRHGDGRDRSPPDTLDPALLAAFEAAYLARLPVDVSARHLWQVYRRARPQVVDGLAAAPRPGQLRRLAVGALLVAVVLALPGGLTRLGSGSLPGDALYAAKRAHERAQVAQAVSWQQRDAVLFTQAELRLLEVESVARLRPRRITEAVAATRDVLQQLAQSPVPATRQRAAVLRSVVAERLTDVAVDSDDATRHRLLAAVEGLSTARPARPRPHTRMVAGAEGRGAPGNTASAGDRRPTAENPPGTGPSAAAPAGSGGAPASAGDGAPVGDGGPVGAPASPTDPRPVTTTPPPTDAAWADVVQTPTEPTASPSVVLPPAGASDAGAAVVEATDVTASPSAAPSPTAATPASADPTTAAPSPVPTATVAPRGGPASPALAGGAPYRASPVAGVTRPEEGPIP